MLPGQGIGREHSGLSEEDGLYLEEVVAVVGAGIKRHGTGPCLERVAVDAEAEVAGQRHEESLLPRAVGLLGPVAYGLGLLLKALGLQGTHP